MAVIHGTAGADTLHGTTGNDWIFGEGDNDVLWGEDGDDTLSGVDGDDVLHGGLGKDRLDGGVGIDTADYSDKTAPVSISLGGFQNVSEVGGVVEDTLESVENLIGGSGADSFSGDGENNALTGNFGNDSLRGGSGDDVLDGGYGNDTLVGGAGDDVLIGGQGADNMNGGDGDDRYYVDSYDPYTFYDDKITDSGGVDTVYSAVGYKLADGIENLVLQEVPFAYSGEGNSLGNTITGNSLGNGLSGGDGDDTLFGGGGNDTLTGGGGHDDLDGGDGADVADFGDKTVSVSVTLAGAAPVSALVGGVAEDTLRNIEGVYGGSADDTLIGDGGSNVLAGNGGADVLEGRGGNDSLHGGDGADWLKGGEGDDFLWGGTGYDVLEGGNGNDTYSLSDSAGGDLVIDTGGVDLVQSTFSYTLGADIENLMLTNGGTGTGNSLDNTMQATYPQYVVALYGLEGNDTLYGDGLLYGGDGNDKLTGKGTLDGGAGDDVLDGGLKLKGGLGHDTLTGMGGREGGRSVADYSEKTQGVVVTLKGDQWVNVQVGGIVEDTLRAVPRITGGTGNDKLKGDEYKNVFRGGDGNDVLWGGAGDDELYGDAGDDVLLPGTGYGTVNGGDGIDTVDFSDWTVSVSTHRGSDTRLFVDGGPTVDNVENITGGSANDTLIGNSAANILQGGAGDDILQGGLGRDSITGGSGIDTADYSDKTAAVSVALRGSQAVDVFVGGVAEDSIWNIENVFGGSGNDTLTGDGNGNLFRGGAGNDVLDGGNGIDTADYSDKTTSVALSLAGSQVATVTVGGVAEDTVRNIENIIGGSANDTLKGDSLANVIEGGAGDDTLTGGTGDDVLTGGAGSDFLKGGGGNDQFVFDAALGSSNIDTVDDFRVGGDLLVLDHSIFTSLTVGTLSSDAFWVGTAAHDATDRIVYNDVTGALFYDINGSAAGGSTQFATLDPGRALTNTDFLVT